ncbi:MAG: signal recognition particle-docking protein FtsY [Hyphomicrobiaceae bacterium]|nr:signal recognition particle-docking protein FtsY [Hyphomicrobiaceae bacterium]
MSGSDSDIKKPGLFGRLFGRKSGDAPAATPEVAMPDEASGGSRVDLGDAAIPTRVLEPHVEDLAAPVQRVAVDETPPKSQPKKSWLSRLTSGLSKTSSKLADGITGIFTKRKLDGDTLEDLEDLLIGADLGIETSSRVIDAISKGRFDKGISPEDVRRILAEEVARVLEPVAKPLVVDPAKKPHVILVVGVNGSGKTTTIGKLAAQFKAEGRSVLLAAGDTFRAAAIDQLRVWGERTNTQVIARDVGADSSGLAFDALKQAMSVPTDVLIVDTAGRLQNKQVLMDELEKVIRVMKKLDPTAPHDCLLVLDATTGQNALNQVEVFRQRAGVSGLVMTKLDGTAKGGILVAIAARFGLPVHAIGVGEGIDDLNPFDPIDFAHTIAQI